MKRLLIALAATALASLSATPAQAQRFTATGDETQRMMPQMQGQYRGEFATRTVYFGSDGRTPKYLNRLILEASPYLRQHAHNPVDWRPWNEETLAYAQRVNKPIFLSIGYATCHWCHVMEHESFDNEEMAGLINELFVPVKVDREQNPDVDLLYMTALQLSSETAGWPLTGFLMPNAKPFFVDSYMPPVLLDNVIGQVRNYWDNDQAALVSFSEELSASVQGFMTAQRDAATLGKSDNDRALVFFIATTDPRHGGYGRAPKFPREPELMWALDVLEQNPNADVERSLTLSLDGMMAGGIHDQIGGGFHRYAVDNVWEIPHFEKMLYNQAQLLQVYARASVLLDRPDYRRVAERIATFVLRDMTSPDGLFMSGYDADSEGREGPFYIWTEAEIDRVLTREEAAWAKLALEIDDDWANFEGQSLPTGRKKMEWREDVLDKLERARREREWPLLDNKRITAWNAQMVEAFAVAGRVLERPDYQTVALQSAERLWNLQMRNGVQRFSNDGRVSPTPGVLGDYAFSIKAFVRLYDLTGDPRWLNRSMQLADTMHARFWDPALGLYTEADQRQNTLFVTPVSTNDAGRPSASATAVFGLTELGRRIANPQIEQRAAVALAGISGRAAVAPTAHGTVWRSVLRRIEPGHTSNGTAVTTSGIVRGWIERDSLVLAIQPGWHINSFNPRQSDLVGTRVRFDGQGQSAVAQAPNPRLKTLSFSPEPLETYEGFLRLPLVGRGAHLMVDVQACDNRRCLPPETLRLPLPR